MTKVLQVIDFTFPIHFTSSIFWWLNFPSLPSFPHITSFSSEEIFTSSSLFCVFDFLCLSQSEGGSDLLYDVPVYLVVVLSIAYGAVSLAAVVGNGAVLWFVVRQQRLRNVTNLFIANLSIADILIGAFAIPFQFLAALLQRWILPNFMCAFCSFVQIVSVNVSIFTLAAIAADRYFIVVNPIDQRITKEKAKKIIGLIWCVAVTAAAPAILALKVNMVPDVIDIQDYSSDDFNDFLVSNYTLLASNFSLPVKPQVSFPSSYSSTLLLLLSSNYSLNKKTLFIPMSSTQTITVWKYGNGSRPLEMVQQISSCDTIFCPCHNSPRDIWQDRIEVTWGWETKRGSAPGISCQEEIWSDEKSNTQFRINWQNPLDKRQILRTGYIS